ncbi:MAG: family 16 glycoside hydrolase [Planctomycetota bacterium]
MRSVRLVVLASLPLGLSAQEARNDGPPATRTGAPPEVLFDGRTLDGWSGDPAVWSVQDGCLVGSTMDRPVAANTFLVWQGPELVDFELSFSVRLEGDNNSGVQYRAQPVAGAPFALAGYQFDVHGDPRYFGMLYEERGRGVVATHGQRVHCGRDGGTRVLSAGADAGAVDLGAWHAMRIEARGNVVRHYVDGALAVEVIDDDPRAARRGGLGLQVHAGAPMQVWFQDLVLRRLPTEEIAAASPDSVPGDAPPTPQWIWDRSAEDGEELFLRREFELPAAPAQATLAITCDNHFRVYVNGVRVGNGDQWEAPRALDVRAHLRAGGNAIAVHAWNDGGPAGLCAQLSWRGDDARGVVCTDGSWTCGGDDPDGWDTAGFAGDGFAPATVLAPLGGGPWAGALRADAFAELGPEDLGPQPPRSAPELGIATGWRHERLLTVPRTFGSWVAMCRDPQGRLYASDQSRGLYRVLPAGVNGRVDTAIEPVDVDLDGCQGLCWAFGALYAVANGAHSGLYRLTDRDGDDVLDHVEVLRALDGRGEHGAHAVVVAPDGEHLLVLCGNHTAVPELARSRVPHNWQEDALLPRIDDPNGHAVGIRAPGGFVCQVDRDGREWELLCCGFRNAYDLAVLPNGDVVTYDADMEWDMGMPWYRPTRVLQVLSGVDYGWRTGSTKWAVDYPDTLPGMLDIGPGSPTGVVSGQYGALALDWTFGLVHRILASPAGGGLTATARRFTSGVPFPVTDAVVAPPTAAADGHSVYLLTGGRGVRSALYRFVPQRVGTPRIAGDADRRDERLLLEAYHGRRDARALAVAWPFLGDDDPVLRHAARIAVESQPLALWRDRALTETGSPWSALEALLALARQGGAEDLEPLLRALGRVDRAALDGARRVAWLRVHGLALLRLGPAPVDVGPALVSRLQPLLPSGDLRVDAELCALLAHLDAPLLLERALPLLSPMQPDPAPPWAEVAARNDSYGRAITAMLDAMPPTRQLAIANALRTVEHGWTLEQRRAFFAFLRAAKAQKGGASYQGYLQAMLDQVWDGCTDAERRALREVAGKDDGHGDGAAVAAPAAFRSTPPQGPGRDWQLADAVAVVRARAGREPDLASGHNLFLATGCVACHRFAGEGGGAGPDLTSLGNKFTAADVLEAILEPGKVVSDQFQGAVLTRTDGSTLFGRVSARGDGDARVYEVVTASADGAVVRVPAAEVRSVEPAKLSPMPEGLVDRLSESELLDLLAFLRSRGEVPERR